MVKKFRKGRRRAPRRRHRRMRAKFGTHRIKPYYKAYMFKRAAPLVLAAPFIDSAVGTATSPNTGQLISYTADALFLATGVVGQIFTYYSISMSFTLSQIPSYTEFTNLYDRYMLMGVSIKFIPLGTQSNTESVATGSGGQEAVGGWVYSVVDYDDNALFPATPAGVASMRMYPGFQAKNIYDTRRPGVKRYIRPRTAIAQIDSTGAVVATANQRHTWIDCSNPNIQHYGLKIIFEIFQPTASSAVLWFRPEMVFYFKCRDLR